MVRARNLTDDWKNYWDKLPFEHCTDIIVYSMYLDADGKLRMKRSTIIGGRLGHPFSMETPYHRGIRSNVYITYGGSRADSPAIGKSVLEWRAIAHIVDQLHDLMKNSNYRGLNLDWDHPKDACQQEQGLLYKFLHRFSQDVYVLLTVPPDAHILKQLRLQSLVTYRIVTRIEHIIVATHRLRAQGLVCCTGGLNEASMVFWAIKKVLPLWLHHRLAYSIALGADTYFSNSRELWTPGVPLSRFYDPAQGTMKMSYKEVCKLPTVNKTDECVLSIAARNSSGYKMVAFAGTEQLRNRLVKTNYYEMDQYPVVIYDIELDDYEGVCEKIKWPLTRAFSEPFNQSLRHP
ncbi:hypothetical protein HPB49_009519 [Dermacentor silvarum]|uniref:Uncharacterized protein n=1 Tax=Dermacentor silvarum TaxID=543639 RepID=A0ACB8C8M6_DERSI|nr:hypothetical protein HPB49_009519 [Dermacentor silvarum]